MIQKLSARFKTIKPYLPTVCFVYGTIWDSVTLRRIDNTLDLVIFSVYMLLAAAIVILIGRNVRFRFSEYLPAAAQFFFGGLFSGATVFYFKSTSSLPTFLFLLLLAGLLVGNEFLEKRYSNAQVTFSLWSISVFMILNFLLPVLLHHMNYWVFLLGVLAAFGACVVVRKLAANGSLSLKPVGALYALLTLLYFLNVIPPVPLAKKELGIFRSVHREGSSYVCSVEKPSRFASLKKREKVYRFLPGDTVYCFSSVFAPTSLSKQIYHHWYFKDPGTGKYSERGKFGYKLKGGRSEGYRGYTLKKNVQPGTWKVKLKTDDGKTVGITKFAVVPRDPDTPVSIMHISN